MKDKSGHKEKVVNGITVGGFGRLLGSEEQPGSPRSGKAAFLRRGDQGQEVPVEDHGVRVPRE